MASELVADAPDLILVQTVPATRALMQATKSIPIVMVGVANPIELGIVSGFVKPGGNITGASFLGNEFASKLLQYVKAAAPRLRSVDLFVNPSNEAVAQFVKHMQADAVAIGMQIRVVEVASPGEFEPAFAAIRKANNGINTASTRTVNPIQTRRHCGLRAHSRNAAGCCGRQPCSSGSGLMAFGPARDEYARLAARYIDRMSKGAKPGELSIEQPTRFHLVINLKSAKALGLTIPQSMLLSADEKIE